MTTKHTPTQYEILGYADLYSGYVLNLKDTLHKVIVKASADEVDYIVRCVNSHDVLVAALKLAQQEITYPDQARTTTLVAIHTALKAQEEA